MRIKCLHGYFIFEESKAGQVADLINLFGFALSLKDGYYTFSSLAAAPEFSILGDTYLGALATKTFEGKPWEVMRENGLVYDFSKDQVVPIISVTQPIELSSTNRYFLSNGMILAGSLTDEGSRVKDYAAHYSFELAKFKYSEVSFE